MKKLITLSGILLPLAIMLTMTSCASSESNKSTASSESNTSTASADETTQTSPVSTLSNDDYEYIVLDDGTVEITRYLEQTGNYCEVSVPSTIDGHTVTRIGKEAFATTGITGVTIPDSVTYIGESAFEGCTSLETVRIGKAVTKIEDSAFINPHYESLSGGSLKEFTVDNENTAFQAIDGNLYSKNVTRLIRYANAKSDSEFDIPDTVTDIAAYAFFSSANLTSVAIPDSVKSIGECAFFGCVKLLSVTVPASVKSIGDSAIGHYYDCFNEGYHTEVIGFKGSAAESYALNDTMCDFKEKKD